MIRPNEGVRANVYRDSLGIETIGVGFNLRRGGARESLAAVGADHAAVLAGKESLAPWQIDTLLDCDIAVAVADLRKLMPGYDDMPETARLVLLDMRFQLGGAGLRGFKYTLAAFRAGEWKKAADGMRASLAYKQTPKRWERNASSIEHLH